MSIIIDKLKQYPIAVLCAVLLVVCGVLIFLRGGVASELSLKESDLDARIKVIEKNKKSSNGLEKEEEDLSTIVEKMKGLLFDRYERAINIGFFYEFEDRTGVVISKITQLETEDPIYEEKGPRGLKLHSTVAYNLNLTGSFENVLKFLHEVDRVDPLMRVADFRIARGKNELGGAEVDAALRIIVMAKKD